MKTYLLISILTCLLLSCNRSNDSTNENSTSNSPVAVENIRTLELNVSGMTCEGCENTIESTLTDIDGVVSAEASHTNAVANVTYDSTKVNREELAVAINKLGYKVEE